MQSHQSGPDHPGSDGRTARILGILLLMQSAAGALVNFGLLGPVMSAPEGYLPGVAANEPQVRAAALVGLATGAVTIIIAITAWPVFRRYSERLALAFLSFSTVSCTLLTLEHTHMLTLLSLGREYAQAGGPAELYLAAGTVVRSARRWAHYANLLTVGGAVLVLYLTLRRYSLVPGWLAGLGLLGATLHIIAVTLPLLGYPIIFQLIFPLGLSQLILAFWLMVRGFNSPVSPPGPAGA
jgi:hypothetical protein